MVKKHFHKIIHNKKKYLPLVIGAIVLLLALLLYVKIYFPARSSVDEDSLPIIISEGDITRAGKIDIASLRSFTGDYIISSNALSSIRRFYDKTHDEQVGFTLIQMYISNYAFDDAFSLIKDIYKSNIDFTKIPASTFLYVLFNSSQLSPSNYDLIKGILEDYKNHVRIDDETYTLYNGLLAVYKDDTDTFYKNIGSLSGSKQFEGIVQGIQSAKNTSKDIEANVPYYKDALSALVLLQQGYFRVAQKRAVSVRQQDSKYVLPYQILAQAALLQAHWQEAGQYFDALLKLDNTHNDQYHFGLCRSYFWQGSYDNAILHCKQVKDKNNAQDALRYVVLSYYQTKNREGMMDTFQVMLNKQKPSENDYYTFFDVVFYQPYVTDKDYSHIQQYYISVILPYLDHCVTTFGATKDVCRYGQAGFYLYKNEIAKAYKDLLYLASRHPSSYVFRALGSYYESDGQEDKAKAYYLKSISSASGNVIDISSVKKSSVNNPLK